MSGKMIFILIMNLASTAWSKPKLVHPAPRPLTKQEVRFLDNLFTRCDDGSGADCNAYGQALIELDPRGNSRVGAKYVRRACALAYRPACGRKIVEVDNSRDDGKTSREGCLTFAMKTITSDAVNLPGGAQGQMITSISKESPLVGSGIQIGDVIVKLNNDGVPSGELPQIKGPDGKVVDLKGFGNIPTIEINRKGVPLTIPVRCK